MSIVQRTRRAAEIAGFIAALAASCALPSYQIERRDETSSAGSGGGGRGASGSDAASSSSQGGLGGADGLDAGSDADSGKGDTDAAVCNGDFGQCDNPSAEGQPCSCKGNICLLDKCDLTGGGNAHGLICKPDPKNLDQLLWTALPDQLQCCPENKRPCRPDLEEICVQTQKPVGVACVKNTCDTGQNLDCQGCAAALCVDMSTVCEVKSGIVICSPPP